MLFSPSVLHLKLEYLKSVSFFLPQQQSLWDSIIYNLVSVHWTCKYGADSSQRALSHREGLRVAISWEIFSFLRYALKYTPRLISEQMCCPRFLILCLIFMGVFFLHSWFYCINFESVFPNVRRVNMNFL